MATVNADILGAVAAHARREALADHGLSFIRRTSTPGTHDYFVTNLTAKTFNGWVKLGVPATSVRISNPLDGHHGQAATGAEGSYLQLAPRRIAAASHLRQPARVPPWPYRQPAAAPCRPHRHLENLLPQRRSRTPARPRNHRP